MIDFNESETKKNLENALKGEALAHLKYQFYRSKLIDYNKKYESIMDEIIHNEKEHGKIWFKKLNGESVPRNLINLLDAIEGETYEHLTMYPKYSEIAEREGFIEISRLFKEIAIIEGNHSKQFEQIKKELEDNYYNYDGYWKCLNCGHIVKSNGIPEECPVCKHPRKYFERL